MQFGPFGDYPTVIYRLSNLSPTSFLFFMTKSLCLDVDPSLAFLLVRTR